MRWSSVCESNTLLFLVGFDFGGLLFFFLLCVSVGTVGLCSMMLRLFVDVAMKFQDFVLKMH